MQIYKDLINKQLRIPSKHNLFLHFDKSFDTKNSFTKFLIHLDICEELFPVTARYA